MHALTSRGRRRAAALLAIASLAAFGETAAAPTVQTESLVVLGITEVELTVTEATPPELVIRAKATVPSSGWTGARLYYDIYVSPPEDGIWGITFHAHPPAGRAAAVVSTLTASENMGPVLDFVRGIKVRGRTNSCTAYLDGRPMVCRP